MPSIKVAIARAAAWAHRPQTPEAFDLNLDPTPEEVRTYAPDRSVPLAVDVETPREQHTDIKLCGFAASGNGAIVFPWTPEFADAAAEPLRNDKLVKVGHNFAYDQLAFRANGIEPRWPLADTIQAAALLWPPFREAKKRRWLALSTCVMRVLDGVPYWKDADTEATRALYRAWFPKVPEWLHPRLYCALDCIFTWRLWQQLRVLLKREGMWELYTRVVAPAAPILVDMEERGMPIDRERFDTLKDSVERRVETLKDEIAAQVQEWHDRRLASLTQVIESTKEVINHAIANHPLFTTADSDSSDALQACDEHPEYRGLTKRAKCEGCAAIYRGAGSLRRKVKELRGAGAKRRAELKRIGSRFDGENDNHWRWLLFDPTALKLMPVRVTEKKALPGVDADDIEALQRLYPEVGILKARVELQHALHRLRFIFSIPIDVRGRAHFAYSLHRTENGRVASGLDEEEDDKVRNSPGGNAQNITEEDRQIVRAEPGMVLMEHDASQIELRVMAWLARDIELLGALASGGDIHTLNAAAIFGCGATRPEAEAHMVPFEGKMRSARAAAKRSTHGWDYGMMDVKAGRMFQPFVNLPLESVLEYLRERSVRTAQREGVSEESWKRRIRAADNSPRPEEERRKLTLRIYETANTLRAREWRIAYFRRWHGLATFQSATVEKVNRERLLVNPFGRKLQFWRFQYDKDTQAWTTSEREEALAFLPASTVADMAKKMLPEMAGMAHRFGGELLTMTHDSFLAMIPDKPECISAYNVGARGIMEQPWPQLGKIEPWGLFSCPSDAKIGHRWAPAAPGIEDGLRRYEG